MSKEMKAVIISALICIIGAILVDLNIKFTGVVTLIIGVAGIILGPTLTEFE